MRNSLICKLIKREDKKNDHKVKKIIYSDEISKLIKAFPKDIAAFDKRSVLAKVNSQGSSRQKPSHTHIPKVGEDNK